MGAFRRLCCGASGCLLLYHGFRALAFADIDIQAIESGYARLREAWATRREMEEEWYRLLEELNQAAELCSRDASKHEAFLKCLEESCNAQAATHDGRESKLLQFGIVRCLRFVALNGATAEIQSNAAKELVVLGSKGVVSKGWDRHQEVFEELLQAIKSTSAKVECIEMVASSLRVMASVGDTKLRAAIDEWMGATPSGEESLTRSNSLLLMHCRHLFEVVRKLIGVVYTQEDRLCMLQELRDKYKDDCFSQVKYKVSSYLALSRFSQVASLFEDDCGRHVYQFEHDLVVYDEANDKNTQGDRADTVSADQQWQQKLRKPFAIEHIFEGQSDKRDRFGLVSSVLLVGDPGTGKTTITKQLAYRWAISEWGVRFEVVYVLPVRALSTSNYDDSVRRKWKSIETAIANECFSHKNEDSFEALTTLIRDELMKKTTLLILDGLDEADATGEHLIHEAMKMEACIMLSTRPYNLRREQDYADREIEVVGMSDAQLSRFLKVECGEEDGGNFVQELKKRSPMWSIAHVPVTAQVLCRLRRNDAKGNHQPFLNTLYNLYSHMSDLMWNRFLEKYALSEIKKHDAFEELGQIAMSALTKGEVLISQDAVLEHFCSQHIKTFLKKGGFLLFRREGNQYQFPHLTFHEFFTGQKLALMILEGNEIKRKRALKVIKKKKYISAFRVAISFMCEKVCMEEGLKGFELLSSIINNSPRDLVGVQHTLLHMRLVEALLTSIEPNRITLVCLCASVKSVVDNANELIQKIVTSEQRKMDDIAREFEASPKLVECFPVLFRTLMGGLRRGKAFRMAATCAKLSSNESVLTKAFCDALIEAVDGGTPWALVPVIRTLPSVVQARPELAEKLFELVRTGCRDGDRYERYSACSVMPFIAEACPQLQDEMLELLHQECTDSDRFNRKIAFRTLLSIAMKRPELAENIWKQLRSEFNVGSTNDPGLAISLLPDVLKVLPDATSEVLQLVIAACIDGAIHARNGAIRELPNLFRSFPDFAAEMFDLLRGICTSDRNGKFWPALDALATASQVRPEFAEEALEVLDQACTHSSFSVRHSALNALPFITPKRSGLSNRQWEQLWRDCFDKDDLSGKKAVETLIAVAPAHPELAEEIWALLRQKCADDDPLVRSIAFEALQSVAKDTLEEADDVLELMRLGCAHEHEHIRSRAYNRLMQMPLRKLIEFVSISLDENLVDLIAQRIFFTAVSVSKSPGGNDDFVFELHCVSDSVDETETWILCGARARNFLAALQVPLEKYLPPPVFKPAFDLLELE